MNDDQISGRVSYQAVSLLQQNRIEGHAVPRTFGDEMVKLVLIELSAMRRHLVHTFAITGADQTRDANWRTSVSGSCGAKPPEIAPAQPPYRCANPLPAPAFLKADSHWIRQSALECTQN